MLHKQQLLLSCRPCRLCQLSHTHACSRCNNLTASDCSQCLQKGHNCCGQPGRNRVSQLRLMMQAYVCVLTRDVLCCAVPCPYPQGVCPTIRFHQYIIASTICISHHRALSVFLGRSLPTLAQLFSGQPVTDVRAAVYRFVSSLPHVTHCPPCLCLTVLLLHLMLHLL